MISSKDINLVFRAGQVDGMARTFADGELESLLKVDGLGRTRRQAVEALIEYRLKLLNIINGFPAFPIEPHMKGGPRGE